MTSSCHVWNQTHMKTQTHRTSVLTVGQAVMSSIAIALFASAISTLARPIHVWSEAEMQQASDLIVIGTIANVRDLHETNAKLWPNFKFRSVETTFTLSKVLKGDITNRTVVLHHYRFDPPNFIPPNGPCFLDLKAADTNQFLLYLVRDGAARFSPVSGQLDPSMDAVRPLGNGPAALGLFKTVVDEKSGHYADVDSNKEIVSLHDSVGKVIWSTNVFQALRTNPNPRVSGRKIQGLQVDRGALSVEFDRAWADLDIKTGELKGINSD